MNEYILSASILAVGHWCIFIEHDNMDALVVRIFINLVFDKYTFKSCSVDRQ